MTKIKFEDIKEMTRSLSFYVTDKESTKRVIDMFEGYTICIDIHETGSADIQVMW